MTASLSINRTVKQGCFGKVADRCPLLSVHYGRPVARWIAFGAAAPMDNAVLRPTNYM
jgi:hypothetical protein